MEMQKEDTKMIQGLSVIAMLILHLFCRYNSEDLFTSIFYVRGVPLSYILGQLSDFCVMGFAFCSGYAHYLLWRKNDDYFRRRLKSLVSLYLNFWVICIVFSIISIAIGKGAYMPGDLKQFVLTLTSVEVAYNGAWWYLFIYAIITLTSPLTLKYIEKQKVINVFLIGFILYCVAFYVRFHTPGHGWILEKFGTGGMTYFEWLLGVIFCKEKILTKIKEEIVDRIPKCIQIIVAIVSIIGMLVIRGFFVRSLFVAPATGIVIIIIFHYWNKAEIIKSIFLFMGKHSTNIWLVHMFFFSGLFVNLVFKAKYPIFIFLFILILSILSSYIIDFIYKPINNCLMNLLN